MREVAIVQAVVRSIVLRMRLRSRISRKHDLEIAEMCLENARLFSKMTPKLRAESTGVSVTSLSFLRAGVNQ